MSPSATQTNGHTPRAHIRPGAFASPADSPSSDAGLYQPVAPPPAADSSGPVPSSRVEDMARYESHAIEGMNRSREDTAFREKEVERLSHERRVEDLGLDVAEDIWGVVLELLPGERQYEGWVVRAHVAAMLERAWRKGFEVGRSDQDSPR